MDDIERLRAFAREIIQTSAFEGYSLEGDTVQELAEQFGLINRTTYDPAKHGSSDWALPGDEWFVFSSVVGPSPQTREGA